MRKTDEDDATAYVAALGWAHAKGCPLDGRMCAAAASHGQVGVLGWARNALG